MSSELLPCTVNVHSMSPRRCLTDTTVNLDATVAASYVHENPPPVASVEWRAETSKLPLRGFCVSWIQSRHGRPELFDAALALPPDARLEFASKLLASVEDGPGDELADAMDRYEERREGFGRELLELTRARDLRFTKARLGRSIPGEFDVNHVD